MEIKHRHEAQFINPYTMGTDIGHLKERLEYEDLIENIAHNLFENRNDPNISPNLLNFLRKKDFYSVKFYFLEPIINQSDFLGTEKQMNAFVQDIYKSLCEKSKEYFAQKEISDKVKSIQKKVEAAMRKKKQKELKKDLAKMKRQV